ncbi:uracil-DNA glycosylase family protein [Variovorax sp. J22R133]|uniref:uracil-DNA glycosylase family protein n=1 Tax=Variovorax brevis TaxID=3053503 RepID=UPI00257571CE|nr:uracil-DNA glycosylase family protein [Variovorax sp. J22R133]MDM0115373.1 uracil-DNA glycosylase family protein [Variovorax sp. J22R133]
MTAPNTLNLDKRQREMLEAMGIKVWWPETPTAFAATEPPVKEPEPRPVPVRDPPAPSRPEPVEEPKAPPAPSAAPTRQPVTAASQGASGVLVDAPRRLYGGQDEAVRGGWLIVADMAPDTLGRYAAPFDGDEGRLLDNMLRALQLHSGAAPVHLVRTHRGTTSAGDGLPRPFEEAFAPQMEPLSPRVVLALGPLAAQSLLQRAGPIGKLRGEVVPLALLPGAHVVATYHPAYLLRAGADKSKAWADLCLAAAVFERGAS